MEISSEGFLRTGIRSDITQVGLHVTCSLHVTVNSYRLFTCSCRLIHVRNSNWLFTCTYSCMLMQVVYMLLETYI